MDNKIQQRWEHHSTVRSRPRLKLDSNESGYFYPLSRQLLCIHPKVHALGDEASRFLLVQSFYKYTNDITLIETRLVNQAILSIITNSLAIPFSDDQKTNLLTIMIDEAYHAYVAHDATLQIKHHTKITPVALPDTLEIELAIEQVLKKIPALYHGFFKLIAVCIAENTLTQDMIDMLYQKEATPFFYQMLQEHVADEGRHATIFSALLEYVWHTISAEARTVFTTILPEFLKQYLSTQIQQQFERTLLYHLNFSTAEIEEIIMDTYYAQSISPNHPMLKNIMNLFNRINLSPLPVL